MMDHGPICSQCTRDWDERLGYCEHCDTDGEDSGMTTAKTRKKKAKGTVILFPRRSATDTPVYDQVTTDLGFAPDQLSDWSNIPAAPGLLEDNFS